MFKKIIIGMLAVAVSVAVIAGAAAQSGGLTPLLTVSNGLQATIVGDTGEVLEGTPNPDVIQGNGGNDTILGFEGADTICGGGGEDVIRAPATVATRCSATTKPTS